jgi:hypothetical protein
MERTDFLNRKKAGNYAILAVLVFGIATFFGLGFVKTGQLLQGGKEAQGQGRP